MNTEFMEALSDLEHDKGIKKDILLEAIETALISAYKRHFGADQNARVEIDGDTGEIKVFAIKNVAEEITDAETQITVEAAKEINPKYEAGDVVET
ncbi:MAG: NusA N-terminal domain-containing protein, partial [Christensenella sp.]